MDLPPSTVLSSALKDTSHTLISDAFGEESVPVDVAPVDAFKWVNELDLDSKLNNYVVGGQFLKGEFLRSPDPRLHPAGTGGPGSLTNINPAAIPQGSVLFVVDVHGPGGGNAKPAAVAGDNVDFIYIECQLPGSRDPQGCEAQTTLKNIYVYAVTESQIVVVVTHQQAQELLFLQATGGGEIAIRKPGDTSATTSTLLVVDRAYIVKNFGY
jgi:hypothetical protein